MLSVVSAGGVPIQDQLGPDKFRQTGGSDQDTDSSERAPTVQSVQSNSITRRMVRATDSKRWN